MEPSFTTPVVRCFAEGNRLVVSDAVAVEDPLEIRVVHRGERRTVAVTMRTPGADADLACGFLFTEGAVTEPTDIERVETLESAIDLHLSHALQPDWGHMDRHMFMSSSCGVCGKTALAAVRAHCPAQAPDFPVEAEVLRALPERLRAAQRTFHATGGIHAAGWFTPDGTLIDHAEDVGRHNALDKLIGRRFQAGGVPFGEGILLLSGRASFELIQKARLAGIGAVAAVGAPSSLAVELAADGDLLLVGFLRPERFNVYSGAHRVTPAFA